MAWESIGQVDMSFDWQFVGLGSITAETLRLTHIYPPSYYARGLIAQVFEGAPYDFYGHRRIYTVKEQIILYMPIAPDIQEKGDYFRQFALKLAGYGKVKYPIWSVTVEVLT